MKVIVPLAGPDFVKSDGSVKSEYEIDGLPLLRRALESRPWWTSGFIRSADLIFVLRDDGTSRRFVEEKLLIWYPGARTVFISAYTRGASLSVLAGCSLIGDFQEIICFDLADILFEGQVDANTLFAQTETGAAALTFSSEKPIYSYLRRNDEGDIIEAAEKRVISKEASVGVYFFRSTAVYLKALAHVFDHEAIFTYKDLLFVCPVLNGVLAQGLNINGVPVHGIVDIKVE